jgi:drug/metabolite transporter (DMT)-like permease
MVKKLTRTDAPGVIVAYVLLLSCPITLVPALFHWQWPSLQALAVLVVVGGIGATANVTMVTAYKLADVSLIEPITFTRLVWASIIAFFLFSEIPATWTLIGGAMIVAATSYIAHREAVAKRG